MALDSLDELGVGVFEEELVLNDLQVVWSEDGLLASRSACTLVLSVEGAAPMPPMPIIIGFMEAIWLENSSTGSG